MQQLQLAYSRRINRPSVQMLNPFLNFTDPLNLHQGNPYLRPEYIHSVELNYAKYWRKGSLTTSLYYRHSSDVFRRMFFVDEETGETRDGPGTRDARPVMDPRPVTRDARKNSIESC